MSLKEKIISILFTILISVFALIPVFENEIEAKEYPNKLYKVYLDGKSIGIIKSKEALENYINEEQKELKEKYNVSTVYLPEGLYIEEYIGYSKNITSETNIYQKIKDIRPFTIKGCVITIKKDNNTLKVNVLKEEDYIKAVESTIKTFVTEKEYNDFFSGIKQEKKELGTTLEDLYVKEEADEKITIKRDALIPSDEKIFTDGKELTRYLLFGTLEEQKEYLVKTGDTIENVAFNNSLGVDEFLIVNPEFTDASNLLYSGEKVNIGLISPIISVMKEEQVVEDVVDKYRTEIKYDTSKPYGQITVTQQGQDGLRRITQKIQYMNGQSLNNAQIDKDKTITLRPTINRIEIRGARSVNDPKIVGELGNWYWPTNTPYIITSNYAYRGGELHDGVDISGTGHGSPIYAANDGNVYETGSPAYYNNSKGGYIVINHNNGLYTVYYHLSKVLVTKGQAVHRGDKIAQMGSTGRSTGTHLHFGVYNGAPYSVKGNSFNPLTLFR